VQRHGKEYIVWNDVYGKVLIDDNFDVISPTRFTQTIC